MPATASAPAKRSARHRLRAQRQLQAGRLGPFQRLRLGHADARIGQTACQQFLAQGLGSEKPCLRQSSLMEQSGIGFAQNANDLFLGVALLHWSDLLVGLSGL